MYFTEAAEIVSKHLGTVFDLEKAVDDLWNQPKLTRKLERALRVLNNNQRTFEAVRECRQREHAAQDPLRNFDARM